MIAFDNCTDIILRSGFINSIKKRLQHRLESSIKESISTSETHCHTLRSFKRQWCDIKSTSTCLCCLHRRAQHVLSCGHVICENCVVVFADVHEDDPSIFRIHRCFLCGDRASEEIKVKIHPPTAGVGILCINGGGARGAVALTLMKRIQDRIGLPIPFQNFFKVAFGISSGN